MALRWYAALVASGGLTLALWGPAWLGSDLQGLSWIGTALVRMFAAIMIAAGCCALGLAGADPLARRHGLSWFIAAHGVLWLMFVIQIGGPWNRGVASQSSWALLAIVLGLLYVLAPAEPTRTRPVSIAASAPEIPAETIRSRYEERIRAAAAQEERNRLARDLHDAIKQQIFAIQTSAAAAEAQLDADRPRAREAVLQVRQSAREAMAEMEALLDQLRIVPLANTGLVEAIKRQGEALAFRTGAQVDVRVGTLPPNDALGTGAHQAIFRVAQEALANIGRHARARHVWVSLDSSPGGFALRIEDDGIGFETGGAARGMGMANMRERAAELKGTIAMQERRAGGTSVLLTVPFETADDLAYRRKRALMLAAVFGVASVSAFTNLVRNGFVFANVFLVFFLLAFAHNLLIAWRLRPSGVRRPAAACT